jgi:perosamine synthetase
VTINERKIQVPWSGRGQYYTEDEIAVVVQAMQDADPLTQGRYQTGFEERFAQLLGAPKAFAVSSCTAALELAAALIQLGPEDEVVLPAHTFAATAIPFARTGAKLVWADIDPATRVVTADTLRRVVTPRTRVIVAVHLYGLVCEMDPILDLAKTVGAFVVEDAAQALGARYKGRHAGTMGDFGCFSFHSHKNVSTLGEGGMLTVRDAGLAAIVPGLRHNGVRAFTGDRLHYWKPAMSNVDFDIEGLWPFNFCIGEVQCALGLKLLERLDQINAERMTRGRLFIEALADFPELSFQTVPPDCGHAYHLLAARYDGAAYGAVNDDLIELLAFGYGVKTVVQYCPLYRYPMFQRAGFGAADCPATDDFYDNMISFPFQHWMSDVQFSTMIEATTAALLELRRRS